MFDKIHNYFASSHVLDKFEMMMAEDEYDTDALVEDIMSRDDNQIGWLNCLKEEYGDKYEIPKFYDKLKSVILATLSWSDVFDKE